MLKEKNNNLKVNIIMKQLKKTILTLVALLALTTGAWAQGVLNIVVDGTSATIKYDGNASNNPILGDGEWEYGGGSWDEECTIRPTITTVTIDGSCKNFSGTNLHGLFIEFSGLTTINGLENLNTANVQDMGYMFTGCSSLTSLDLSSWNTASVEFLASMFNECSELTTVDLSSWNTAKVWNMICMFNDCSMLENIYVGDGWSTAAVDVDRDNDMFKGCTKLLSMNTANPATNKTNAHTGDGGYLKVKPAAATAVDDFAWDEDKKTGTFTMPADNVFVSVEYYDQATLADKGLTAAVDAAAKTEAPLAVLAENAITGGTVMYYVAPDANFSQADAIALAETAWSADIPTAETIDAAGGTCYVWYYIKGDDEHSDTDPQLLQVTVLPEPTYTVEVAEGTEESDKWTVKAGTDGSFQSLPLKGVKAGTKVKLKYDGDRSMLKGVTAVKKAAAAAKTLAEATSEDLGKVVGADGKIYATKADAEAVATGNAVAMICYVKEGHGLALALTDESDMDWSSAKTTCAAHTPAVTGATWKLASKSEMSLMINAAGNYAALRNGFSAVGGTNLSDEYYWLSDESSADYAEYFNFGYGSWSQEFKSDSCKVRACLAF